MSRRPLYWPKLCWVRAMAQACHFRLRRRAFAVAFLCQGAIRAAGGMAGVVARIQNTCLPQGARVSCSIRLCSEREKVPHVITSVRREIVSHEAKVNPARRWVETSERTCRVSSFLQSGHGLCCGSGLARFWWCSGDGRV